LFINVISTISEVAKVVKTRL